MSAGQVIASRFKIADLQKDLLGQGAMSQVYRAADMQTGETVAVKVLDPNAVTRSPEALERFRREGKALCQLNHPNIVKLIASIEEKGRYYLVVEFVPGGSLQTRLTQNKRLPAPQVIEMGRALANALGCAHRLGIYHRDLKPANVLLATDGAPRITDFGCAFIVDRSRLTQAGVLVGTTCYLSPESILSGEVDARADLWALGVMLFELLSGQRPFSAGNLTGILTAILTQPSPDLERLAPGVPPRLANLVGRLLEKDPQQRISSLEQVEFELYAIGGESSRG